MEQKMRAGDKGRRDGHKDKEMGTKLTYECPARRHYFGFDVINTWTNVGNSFVSYFWTTNVRYINVTCTKDR